MVTNGKCLRSVLPLVISSSPSTSVCCLLCCTNPSSYCLGNGFLPSRFRASSRISNTSVTDIFPLCKSSRAMLGVASWNLKPHLASANLLISLIKSNLPQCNISSLLSDNSSGSLLPVSFASQAFSIIS